MCGMIYDTYLWYVFMPNVPNLIYFQDTWYNTSGSDFAKSSDMARERFDPLDGREHPEFLLPTTRNRVVNPPARGQISTL